MTAERLTRAERDVEYLRGRTLEVVTELLDHPMLVAQQSWPQGANGPIAIAAYEALAERTRAAIFMLRAMLVRTERGRTEGGEGETVKENDG